MEGLDAAADASDSLSYSLVAGSAGCSSEGNDFFDVSGATLRTNRPLDHEAKSSFAICLRIEVDGGNPDHADAGGNIEADGGSGPQPSVEGSSCGCGAGPTLPPGLELMALVALLGFLRRRVRRECR